MTQLVLHTGPPMTSGNEIQARLIGWREPLAKAGVILFPQDRPDAWDRAVQQLATGDSPQQVRKLVRQSLTFGAGSVLLSSDGAYRKLRKGKNVKRLLDFSESSDVTLKVVLVVRDQLDMLNALYCQQIMSLETFGDFEPFVMKAVNSELYNYAQSFRALLDSEEAGLVAVPFSALSAPDPARALLLAAGVATDVVDSLPDDPAPEAVESTVGPVLLTATRLMHKRLVRFGISGMRRPSVQIRAVGRLRARALENEWDVEPFWGWRPDLAAATATIFRHSNAEFAAGAWRADWRDPVPARTYTKPDLASRGPDLVADVMDTIQATIDELVTKQGRRGKRAKQRAQVTQAEPSEQE